MNATAGDPEAIERGNADIGAQARVGGSIQVQMSKLSLRPR